MPGKLSRESIINAALALLDSAGLEGVRLRALANELGVKAPAIYWHFRDKQELLDEMATEVWRRIGARLDELPLDQDWREDVRAFAAIERSALLEHRDGAKAFSGTYLTDPAVLTRQEQSLARWVSVGFSLTDVVRAFELVHSFTVGFCIEEQAVEQTARSGDDRYSLDARAARLDVTENPLVVASGPAIFGDADARFEALIELIIDAISQLQAEA